LVKFKKFKSKMVDYESPNRQIDMNILVVFIKVAICFHRKTSKICHIGVLCVLFLNKAAVLSCFGCFWVLVCKWNII